MGLLSLLCSIFKVEHHFSVWIAINFPIFILKNPIFELGKTLLLNYNQNCCARNIQSIHLPVYPLGLAAPDQCQNWEACQCQEIRQCQNWQTWHTFGSNLVLMCMSLLFEVLPVPELADLVHIWQQFGTDVHVATVWDFASARTGRLGTLLAAIWHWCACCCCLRFCQCQHWQTWHTFGSNLALMFTFSLRGCGGC